MGCEAAEGAGEEFKFDVRGRSENQRYSDERVLPDGLIFMRLRRYCSSEG